MLSGARILVTGATGRVGFPIARELAANGNTVFGLARFRDPIHLDKVLDVGIHPVVGDLHGADFADLPDGITYVFHAGAALGREAADWAFALEVNALSTGRLMRAVASTCRGFVYCSTGSTYRYQGRRPLREDDPPGIHTTGNYSFSKVAGEAIVRHVAEEHGVPATIIRIFSTYGPEGGAPWDRIVRMLAGEEVVLHPDAPNLYNPIYEDDQVRLGIRALEVASVPAVVVNWGGSETVSVEDYLEYAGSLCGVAPRIVYGPEAYHPLWPDVTAMHEVLGRCEVPWRDGFRRMLAAKAPDRLIVRG
jgi:nucleoside-diphosphate-sugar epimerase